MRCMRLVSFAALMSVFLALVGCGETLPTYRYKIKEFKYARGKRSARKIYIS
ncbi:hypothetical protein KCG44_14280 [Pacificimonas sp. WHA3]|uniref:Lipoprotein n=1 Tax=Pacificimonas pallii TaxID=2827236 RepID=A0ABS6SHQ2_9SPHN|nr:hypothetical protein [Pacificimonas pallii]MBV7257949.1 hypothetical protein [Pacificimonas pallii]